MVTLKNKTGRPVTGSRVFLVGNKEVKTDPLGREHVRW